LTTGTPATSGDIFGSAVNKSAPADTLARGRRLAAFADLFDGNGVTHT
jgi:hypothetical protein